MQVRSLGRKNLLEETVWKPTPVFLPGESNGQGNLAGYSPWGHKWLDTTEVTYHTCTETVYKLRRAQLAFESSSFRRSSPKVTWQVSQE